MHRILSLIAAILGIYLIPLCVTPDWQFRQWERHDDRRHPNDARKLERSTSHEQTSPPARLATATPKARPPPELDEARLTDCVAQTLF
jgi:hypothetical protein